MTTRTSARTVPVLAIALLLVIGGLAAGSVTRVSAQGTPSATPAGDRYTPEEVSAATGSKAVTPIYAVPKDLQEEYVLAFINPGQNIPFFHSWSEGMNAAADFYGVDFIETDLQLKYEETVNQFETLLVRDPDVLGTLTTAGPALKARADAAGIPIIPIDIPIEGNPYFLGIPNEKAGRMGGELVAAAAQERLAGDWQGRNLVYIGLGETTCEPCETRVQEGLAAVRETLDIPDQNVVMLSTGGQTEPTLTAMTDTLTAHPNDVMIIVAMNDEAAAGAIQAVRAAGRTEDVLMVSLGADRLGRDIMRADADGAIVALVDFNPWAQGWNWVEAAIAVAEGEEFAPYDISRIVTRENIDELFPDDD